MLKDHKHKKDNSDLKDLSSELFTRTNIAWERSRVEIWKDLSVRLQEEGPTQTIVRRFLPGKQWLAFAASFALLLAVAGFMRFHAVEVTTPSGEHASVQLPDGSRLELNAQTSICYYPYWWRISRRIKLEGEAWFDVEDGNRFRVISTRATTEVLGTSFNVFARDMGYRVACHTGKVKVTSRVARDQVVLTPSEQAQLNHSGSFEVSTLKEQESAPGWTNNLLMFASTPLRLVFDEIERQYGIVIATPREMNLFYSGNFALDPSVENVLTLLCRPFDLTYEQTSGKNYIISSASMD